MDFLPTVFVRRWIGGPTLNIIIRRWMQNGLAEHLVGLLLSTLRRPQGARTQPTGPRDAEFSRNKLGSESTALSKG